MDLSVAIGTTYLPDLIPGVYVSQEFRGELREWIIGDRDGVTNAAAKTQSLRLWPLHHILRAECIKRIEVGGRPETAVAAINVTPRQAIGTFCVPTMARVGLDVFRTGLVQVSDRVTVAMTAWPPMQLLDHLSEHLEAEWDLRDDGQYYRIDFGRDLLGSEPIRVVLQESRSLFHFGQRESVGEMHTACMVRGTIPPASDQPALVSGAVMRVTGVVSDVVTVEVPRSSQPAIVETDQHRELYLQASDLTRWKIESSAVPGDFTVEVGGGASFAPGHLVQIVEDASGTEISEYVSPAGAGRSGRHMGVFDMEVRGERTYFRNGYFSTDEGEGQYVPLIGTLPSGSGTVFTISNLPASRLFQAGTKLRHAASNGDRTIVSNFTTDGSGSASITVDAVISIATGPHRVEIWEGPDLERISGVLPNDAHTFLLERPRESFGLPDLLCDYDGMITTAGVDYGKFQVSGLTEGDEIWPCDRIRVSATLYTVLEYAIADSAGELLARVSNIYGVTTISPSTDAEILRPRDISSEVTAARWLASPWANGTTWDFRSEDIALPYVPQSSQAVALVALVAHRTNYTSTAAPETIGNIKIEVVRSSDSVVLSSTTSAGDTIPIGDWSSTLLLRAPLLLSVDTTVHLRVFFSTSGNGGVYFARYLGILLSSDEEVPETPDSHAQPLHQETQRRLLRHRFGIQHYRGRAADLIRRWDLPTLDSMRLRKGQRVMVEVPSEGFWETLRIERVSRTGDDPDSVEIEFESLPRRFSDSVRVSGDQELGFIEVQFRDDLERQSLVVRAQPATTGLPVAEDPDPEDADDPFEDDPSPPEEALPVAPPS